MRLRLGTRRGVLSVLMGHDNWLLRFDTDGFPLQKTTLRQCQQPMNPKNITYPFVSFLIFLIVIDLKSRKPVDTQIQCISHTTI